MSKDIEYNTLRAEIMEVSTRQYNLINFSVTSSSVFLALAVQTQQPIVALVPIIILSLGGVLLVNHAYAIVRISAYLQCFIEGEDLQWESSMCRLRKYLQTQISPSKHQRNSTFKIRPWPTYELLLIGTGAMCLVAALLLAINQGSNPTMMILCLAVTLFWSGFSYNLRKAMHRTTTGEIDEFYKAAWRASNVFEDA